MPVTNVKTRWVDGNLYFYDAAGNEIMHIDGTAGTLSVAAGALLVDSAEGVTASAAELNLLDGSTQATAIPDLTEGAGAIGGTSDGDLPSLASPDDTKLTAAVRELATRINEIQAALRTFQVIAT